jgi:FKBP-type peptidyl-prolyl cis-trans isomerase
MFHKLAIILLLLCSPLAVIGGGQSDSGPTKVAGDPVTLPDGLKYWDVAVGKKFDSSLDAGHPFVFTLGRGQVIPGWDEGLLGMREGGKRQLHIPAELAYGEQGSPPTIPPNSALIFDIQLLNVER